jgi:hypothetical protein
MDIFWELIVSSSGVIVGFFIGETLFKKLGFEEKKEKLELKPGELQKFLKNRFLVNSALISGEKRSLFGVDDVEVDEMLNLLKNLKSDELIIFNRDDCRFALKKGENFIYIRGKIASFRDLAKIWEIVHRSFRGEAK